MRTHSRHFCLSILVLLATAWTLCTPPALQAQASDDPQAMKQKIAEMIKQGNYTGALPLLEKIVVIEPENHEMQFLLGMALMAQANVIPDVAQQKALRIRAREAFTTAKNTGDQHPIVDALISSIPADRDATLFPVIVHEVRYPGRLTNLSFGLEFFKYRLYIQYRRTVNGIEIFHLNDPSTMLQQLYG